MGNDKTNFTRDPHSGLDIRKMDNGLDSQSGRYFMASVQQIREAEYRVNKEAIGIYDDAYSREAKHKFINGCEPSIVLDFNVDGVIYKEI